MSRQNSKGLRFETRARALHPLFTPSILCAALLAASSAMAQPQLSGGEMNAPEAGDYGRQDKLTGNDVRVSGATMSDGLKDIYGAYFKGEGTAPEVTGNNVTITDSMLGPILGNELSTAYGGYVLTDGGNESLAKANSNTATVQGSALGQILGGYAEARSDASGKAEANGNLLQVTDSESGVASGGCALGSGTGNLSGATNYNTLILVNANLLLAYGGFAEALSQEEQTRSATFESNGNRISASADSVTFQIRELVGGLATTSNALYSTLSAANNHVDLSNGRLGAVGGGGATYSSDAYATAPTKTHFATANGNTISIKSTEANLAFGGTASFESRVKAESVTIKAFENIADLYGGSNIQSLFGGNASATGALQVVASATANRATLHEDAVSSAAYGGNSYAFADNEADATSSSNSLTLKDSSTANTAFGGYAEASASQKATALVTGNTFSLTDNAGTNVNDDDSYGGNGGYAKASGDGVLSATASSNTAELSGQAHAAGMLRGGYAFASGSDTSEVKAQADHNMASLSDHAEAAFYVFGGEAETRGGKTGEALVTENTVSLSGSAKVQGRVFAGWTTAQDSFSNTATASRNTASLIGDAAATLAFAGGSANAASETEGISKASAFENNLLMSPASVSTVDLAAGDANATGGDSSTAQTERNQTTVSGGKLAFYQLLGGNALAYHGKNNEAIANENALYVESTQLNLPGTRIEYGVTRPADEIWIAAGLSKALGADGSTLAKAETIGNTLTLAEGAEAWTQLSGGYSIAEKGESTEATASGNEVSLTGKAKAHERVSGGKAEASQGASIIATASRNTVTLSQGSFVDEGEVAGGDARAHAGTDASSAFANENTVLIQGATMETTVRGGFASALGSAANKATASENHVTVSQGALLKNDIIGGTAVAATGATSELCATGNTVVFEDSELAGENHVIAGGEVALLNSEGLRLATENTVSLRGDFKLDSSSSLWGGYAPETATRTTAAGSAVDDLFSGNTLNLDVRKVGSLQVAEFGNFETINLQAGEIKAGDTVLEAASAHLGNGMAGDTAKGTTVNLLSIEDGPLKAGDTLTLISGVDEDGLLANKDEHQTVRKMKSFAISYDAVIGETAPVDGVKSVSATIASLIVNPETKIFSENRAASLTLLAGGADILEDADIGKGRNVFGVIQGGHSRYSTGSHVEVDGVHLATGLANTWSLAKGGLTGAAFIEAGWGDTDTYNSIGGKSLHGSGDSHYYGVGTLGRFELTEGSLAGLYTEGALRIGKLWSDYKNKDARNVRGETASYDISSAYYAAHVGVGYDWSLSEKLKLDTSAKYLWTRVASKNVTILGDDYHFDAMDSSRFRLGAKLEYLASSQCTPYIGLAYEHEFDGKAKGSVEGVALPTADLGGDTGIFSAGVDFKPSKSQPLTVKAAFTGYVGELRGAAGLLKVRYDF